MMSFGFTLITKSLSIGPFDHEVSQTLRLRNPSDIPIAFKVSYKLKYMYVMA